MLELKLIHVSKSGPKSSSEVGLTTWAKRYIYLSLLWVIFYILHLRNIIELDKNVNKMLIFKII